MRAYGVDRDKHRLRDLLGGQELRQMREHLTFLLGQGREGCVGGGGVRGNRGWRPLARCVAGERSVTMQPRVTCGQTLVLTQQAAHFRRRLVEWASERFWSGQSQSLLQVLT